MIEALVLALLLMEQSPEPPADTNGPDSGQLYVTTPLMEPDRCATAWVVKRYVDRSARFEFMEEEDFPTGAIPYDVPSAVLRRDARRATLEVLLQKHDLSGGFIDRLSRLVHDLEVNAWGTRYEPDSREFEETLGRRLAQAISMEEGLRECFNMLDQLRQSDGQIEVWAGPLSEADLTP